MNRVIKEKDGYQLLNPLNSWDMNYHLVDTKYNLDYLIDICDVYSKSEVENEEDFNGLYWEDLKELSDIDYIKEFVWKVNRW